MINKFRIWDGVKLHYPLDEMFITFSSSGDLFFIEDHSSENFSKTKSILGHKDLSILNNFENESLVITQCTPLIDANGKECYIGDIIEFQTTEGDLFTHTIEWSNELCCVMVGQMPYSKVYESGYIQPSRLVFKIVGNKFEK